MLTFQTAIPPVDSRLAFSPDSRYLAIAGRDPFLEILDLTMGNVMPVPKATPFGIDRVWFAPDGRLFASLWNRMFEFGRKFDAKVKRTEHDPYLGGVRGFSPDRRYAFTTTGMNSENMNLIAFDRTVRAVWSIGTPNEFNNFAAVAPDGSRLVTVRSDDTLLERSMKTGEVIRKYPNKIMIRSFAFTADGSRLVARTRTGSPYIWDDADLTRKPRRMNVKHKRNITDMALHPNGRHALLSTKDGPVAVGDLGKTQTDRAFDWSIGSTESVAISRDGLLAATVGEGGQVVVWDLDL